VTAIATKTDGHTIIRSRNKAAILEAAFRLFHRDGYESVSIRDIAAEANIAIGTFYNHFTDKTALFREIVNLHLQRLTPKLQQVRNASTTFQEWSENYFRYLLTDLFENETSHYLFLKDKGAARSLHDLPGFIFAKDMLREDIVAAVAHGLIAPCDIDLLTRMIVGISGEIVDAAAKRGPEELEEIVSFATNFLVAGTQAIAGATTGAIAGNPPANAA